MGGFDYLVDSQCQELRERIASSTTASERLLLRAELMEAERIAEHIREIEAMVDDDEVSPTGAGGGGGGGGVLDGGGGVIAGRRARRGLKGRLKAAADLYRKGEISAGEFDELVTAERQYRRQSVDGVNCDGGSGDGGDGGGGGGNDGSGLDLDRLTHEGRLGVSLLGGDDAVARMKSRDAKALSVDIMDRVEFKQIITEDRRDEW